MIMSYAATSHVGVHASSSGAVRVTVTPVAMPMTSVPMTSVPMVSVPMTSVRMTMVQVTMLMTRAGAL